MTPYVLYNSVSFGSGDGMFHDDNKPVFEPKLIWHWQEGRAHRTKKRDITKMHLQKCTFNVLPGQVN